MKSPSRNQALSSESPSPASGPARPARFSTMDQYLAAATDDQRAALERLRQAVRKVVPHAEEALSYGLPAFRLNGRPLIAFGAARHHCALYPMSPAALAAHRGELKDFSTSKGAIRFQPSKPLPLDLVRKLVRTRLRELTRPAASSKTAARRDE